MTKSLCLQSRTAPIWRRTAGQPGFHAVPKISSKNDFIADRERVARELKADLGTFDVRR